MFYPIRLGSLRGRWRKIFQRAALCIAAFTGGQILTGCLFEGNSNLANSNSVLKPNSNRSFSAEKTKSDIPPDADKKLQRYIDALGDDFDPEVKETLSKIEGNGGRLVALRGYLRSRHLIESRWAWTDEKVKEFDGSPEYKAMMAEVGKVKLAFAEMNPGYELTVNTDVRTLGDQISKWNSNDAAKAAGSGAEDAALRELSGLAYGSEPDKESIEKFERFVRSFVPRPEPTVAVPGLSPHGQLRAFDFLVQKDGEIIAGPRASDAKPVWDESGWTKKLNEAVLRSSNKFTGPLKTPYEPWHYTYVP